MPDDHPEEQNLLQRLIAWRVGAAMEPQPPNETLMMLQQPFVASARVNGLADRLVVYGYALRAALPPIVTFIGFTFGALIGGLLIVEQIFSLPGLGRGILQSIGTRDFIQLNAQAMVLAGSFIAANLIVDLLVPALDRRIARK